MDGPVYKFEIFFKNKIGHKFPVACFDFIMTELDHSHAVTSHMLQFPGFGIDHKGEPITHCPKTIDQWIVFYQRLIVVIMDYIVLLSKGFHQIDIIIYHFHGKEKPTSIEVLKLINY